jgi:hypothetical protein
MSAKSSWDDYMREHGAEEYAAGDKAVQGGAQKVSMFDMFTRLLESKSDDYLRQRNDLDKWWQGVEQAYNSLIAENSFLAAENQSLKKELALIADSLKDTKD